MAMGKTYVLDRVAADLARGFTHPAIQRLSSLVAAYPNDLDLRRRLAAVHRRVGNRIQAGRWDYLTIGADSADTRAFERAFPSAAARLREVRWPHRAGQAATTYARQRLAKLIAAAEAERPAGHRQRPAAPGRTTGGDTTRPVTGARSLEPLVRLLSNAPEGVRRRAISLAVSARRRYGQSWSPAVLLAVAAVVAVPLVVIGLVTVVQWIIH